MVVVAVLALVGGGGFAVGIGITTFVTAVQRVRRILWEVFQ